MPRMERDIEMIDVFTHSTQEFAAAKAAFAATGLTADIRCPSDSYAVTAWSIEDLRENLPDILTDEDLVRFMESHESDLRQAVISNGNEAVSDLADMNCDWEHLHLLRRDAVSFALNGLRVVGSAGEEKSTLIATIWKSRVSYMDHDSEADYGVRCAVRKAQAILEKEDGDAPASAADAVTDTEAQKPKVIVKLEGGLVQAVFSDLKGLEVDVLDLDVLKEADATPEEMEDVDLVQKEVDTGLADGSLAQIY